MKRVWILGFILFLIVFLSQVSFSKVSVKLYLFYSEKIGGLKIEKEFIEPLSRKNSLEIQSFSVDQLRNYDLLIKFEKGLRDEDNDLPIVIIGDKILGGEAEIRKELEGLVRDYSEKGGTAWPSLRVEGTEEEGWIPRAPTEEDKKSDKISYAAFLYMPGCLHCEEMKAEMKKWT